MMTQISSPSPLLQRFPVFSTSDADVLSQMGTRVFGASKIELPNPGRFVASANFAQLDDIALAFATIDSPIVLAYPESDFVRLQIALRANATTTASGRATELNDKQACITSAGPTSVMNCDGGHARLTLRVTSGALDRNLTSLLGFKTRGPLAFTPAVELAHPHTQGLLNLIRFFADQLDLESAALPPLVQRELQQAITVALLYAAPHSFSHLLRQEVRSASPQYVRRAEEYIEANWNRPISIDELVEVTNVSARSLFKSFRLTRGYTPMAFVKNVRLKHARAMLAAGVPQTTVTGVAFICGFGNLGHFAKHYRETFGEAPSDTLAMARRLHEH
jgi:AraC-like DNA-binding protein